MTFKGLGTNWQDHKEQCDAANHRFKTGDLSEKEYRILLASLGFNAVEIDQEVENNRP